MSDTNIDNLMIEVLTKEQYDSIVDKDPTHLYMIKNGTCGSGADSVIDYKVNADGSWYRKWTSGWLEQGGRSMCIGGAPTKITLSKGMNDTNYSTFVQGETALAGVTGTWFIMPVVTTETPKAIDSFYVQASITGYDLGFYYYVYGQGN